MYVFYDWPRAKSHSVVTLFFVSRLWWKNRKHSFCDNIILFMLSMMEQERNSFCDHIIFSMLSMMKEKKKLILLWNYFFYVVYDGARQKAYSGLKLFFVACLWWSNRKNSFSYYIIFFMLSMMEQEKKLILL